MRLSPLMETVSAPGSGSVVQNSLIRIRIQEASYLRVHWIRIHSTGCNWLEIYRGCALEPTDGDRVRGVQPAHEDRGLTEQAGQLLLALLQANTTRHQLILCKT